MNGASSSNGHGPDDPAADKTRANPYAEALLGSKPPELVEFELHTDPYANMVPRVSNLVTSESDEFEPVSRRRNPVVVVVSLVLIAVLALPVMVEVFARLIH